LNDSLAEIYSIIITLDAIEKAYLKDSIAEADYTETCNRLMKQYKSNLANETVAQAFGTLDQFAKEWQVRNGTLSCFPLHYADTAADGMSPSHRATTRWHTRDYRTRSIETNSGRRLC
jgi:hypothetical protein